MAINYDPKYPTGQNWQMGSMAWGNKIAKGSVLEGRLLASMLATSKLAQAGIYRMHDWVNEPFYVKRMKIARREYIRPANDPTGLSPNLASIDQDNVFINKMVGFAMTRNPWDRSAYDNTIYGATDLQWASTGSEEAHFHDYNFYAMMINAFLLPKLATTAISGANKTGIELNQAKDDFKDLATRIKLKKKGVHIVDEIGSLMETLLDANGDLDMKKLENTKKAYITILDMLRSLKQVTDKYTQLGVPINRIKIFVSLALQDLMRLAKSRTQALNGYDFIENADGDFVVGGVTFVAEPKLGKKVYPTAKISADVESYEGVAGEDVYLDLRYVHLIAFDSEIPHYYHSQQEAGMVSNSFQRLTYNTIYYKKYGANVVKFFKNRTYFVIGGKASNSGVENEGWNAFMKAIASSVTNGWVYSNRDNELGAYYNATLDTYTKTNGASNKADCADQNPVTRMMRHSKFDLIQSINTQANITIKMVGTKFTPEIVTWN